jgi:transcriptional regulator with XRE-family HTH domain
LATLDREELICELRDKEVREDIAADSLDGFIALQIKALRQQRDWSQEDLATRLGTRQSVISRMENSNNSSWTVSMLKRFAGAFELPLMVEFGKWSDLVDRLSNLSRQSLERPSFDDDPGLKKRQPSLTTKGYAVPDSSVLEFKVKPGADQGLVFSPQKAAK